MQTQTHQRFNIQILSAAGVLAVSLAFVFLSVPHLAQDLLQLFKETIYWPFLDSFKKTILTPIFFGGVITILTLERLFPAKSYQKIFSAALIQDFLWLLVDGITKGMIILVYVQWLQSIFKNHLSFLTPHFFGELPYWWRFFLGVVIADFLFYLHHWIRHKVPWFWHFHVIHHSQKNLNMFSDQRYHTIEYIIESTIYIFPLLMLTMDVPSIALFEIVRRWHSRLYHSNVRTNFGMLRYIFVTPQSHRVHHSNERKHHDKNFGVLFSVWDQIFGTQYRGWDEYPDTGVNDPLFPNDANRKGIDFVVTMVKQMIYPFQKIFISIVHVIKK